MKEKEYLMRMNEKLNEIFDNLDDTTKHLPEPREENTLKNNIKTFVKLVENEICT